MPQKTLAELAEIIDAKIHGDPDCVISGIGTLNNATAGQISFLDNPRYRKYLPETKASAVILAKDDLAACVTNALITANPYLGYAKAAALFECLPTVKLGIHATAVIGENCTIHPTASIGPHCFIGDNVTIAEQTIIGSGCVIEQSSSIGANSRLWPNVTIYHNVKIGKRAIIHSGTVIGSDGFGFAQDKGVWRKVSQIGGVVISNDVEIGANTTIDRGALEDTIIEEGVKLDNQIQIGHNVRIGAHTAIAGCSAVAGSTTIGKYCAIGGRASIGGHITIADRVMLAGSSNVAHSITEPGIYSSVIPVQSASEWRRNLVRIYQLDDNMQRLRKLEKLVNQLIIRK